MLASRAAADASALGAFLTARSTAMLASRAAADASLGGGFLTSGST
jgi:hypothetical protein